MTWSQLFVSLFEVGVQKNSTWISENGWTSLVHGPLLYTPQPNRSKVFELQQSNQGYGETQGAQEVQKNTFGKYFTEPFLR